MFTEQIQTNICYGNLCIAIRKECETPHFISCSELKVAVSYIDWKCNVYQIRGHPICFGNLSIASTYEFSKIYIKTYAKHYTVD